MQKRSIFGMTAATPHYDAGHGGSGGPTHAGRMLVITDDKRLNPVIDRAATAAGIGSMLGSLADVPAFGGDYSVIWTTLHGAPADTLLADLDAARQDGGVALIFDLRDAAIDPVWSRFGDHDGVMLLANPDEHEIFAALHAAAAGRTMALHSPVETMHQRQLELLQDEVNRIARTLAKMSGPEARMLIRSPDGAREPPSPFIEDQVRERSQSFSASGNFAALGEVTGPLPSVSARDVRRLIRLRRVRDQFFDAELFADPAWDMILDLYAARLEHGRVAVSSLCIAAAVPATTALRWIKALTTAGLFERRQDPHDGRRIFVALSDNGTAAMHAYFAAIVDEGAVI